MKQEFKDPFAVHNGVLTVPNDEKKINEAKKVRVKFNFPLAAPSFDSSIAMKKAKEEKSFIPFDLQMHIDLSTTSNFYEVGKIYEVSEDFYNKFSERKVTTFNPYFGSFMGKAKKVIERPVVPYMIKVDKDGNYVNQLDEKLDLYAEGNKI